MHGHMNVKGLQYVIQSEHNINIQSITHSFAYMFRFHQTILRPIFIVCRYINIGLRMV